MISKLDELLMQLSICDVMYSEYEGEIFYYTSPNGFESILFGDSDNITIWASRYDCLNDASEGTIAQMIYKEVCEEMRINNEITDVKRISNRRIKVKRKIKDVKTIRIMKNRMFFL